MILYPKKILQANYMKNIFSFVVFILKLEYNDIKYLL